MTSEKFGRVMGTTSTQAQATELAAQQLQLLHGGGELRIYTADGRLAEVRRVRVEALDAGDESGDSTDGLRRRLTSWMQSRHVVS